MDTHNNSNLPRAAPTARSIDTEQEVRHVKRKLPAADASQALRIATARRVCRALETEPLLSEDAQLHASLRDLKKNTALRPPIIVTLGDSGRGKSTTNAALIGGRGRHLIASASGKPVTACVSKFFLDVADNAAEYAVLQMRTESEIRALVERQVHKNLGVADFRVPGDFEDIPEALKSLGEEETNPTLTALLSVVDQFIRHAADMGSVDARRIDLDSPIGIQRVHDIIREDSAENRSAARRVDIIKSVDIHLRRPADTDATELQLQDTGLVDTYGTSGSITHTWGIEELLSDGDIDVVLFCVNPRRVTEPEFALAKLINAAMEDGLLGDRQILIIHNAKDEAISNSESTIAITELMDVLGEGRGGRERFKVIETSALAALWSQEALAGNSIENTEKYLSMAIALGLDAGGLDPGSLDDPAFHRAVYKNSGFPELVDVINSITRTYTAEARARAAERAATKTVSELRRYYGKEHDRLSSEIEKHGNPDFTSVRILAKREAAAYAYIGSKRASLLAPDPENLESLKAAASDKLYAGLGEALPVLWTDALVPDRHRTTPTPIINRPMPRKFVSDTEEHIWSELDLSPLGNHFSQRIADAFGEDACQEILRLGFDAVGEVIHSESFAEITRGVGEEITAFSAQIGKSMCAKPEYRLISSKDASPAVVEILEKIANAPDNEAEHFATLLKAIETCYSEAINDAVAAIEGFALAKLADIERDIGDLVFQAFLTLQDNRNAALLRSKTFDGDVQALYIEKQTLDLKREHLKPIETLTISPLAADADADATTDNGFDG